MLPIPTMFEAELVQLKLNKVLRPVEPSEFPRRVLKIGGEIPEVSLSVLSCCDGHQFFDTVTMSESYCRGIIRSLKLPDETRMCAHWKTENGGPFVLSVPQAQTRTYKS